MRMTTNNSNKEKIIFPVLSYKIVGSAFKVFNELGWGLPEKSYQVALEYQLKKDDINFKREVYIPLRYKTVNIGRYYADFVVDDKILLELKVAAKLGYTHVRQLLSYLVASRM